MQNSINKIRQVRLFILRQLDGLSNEQLNRIPEGFNNNIIWNIAHLICAGQGLSYLRSGLPATVDQKYIVPFRTGTKPEGIIADAETDTIKELFINSIDDMERDYNNSIFQQQTYTPSEGIQKGYGITLSNIDDALDFLLYHEGLHSGQILALKRLVV
ncbi:DinB family protein [Flavihumibacter petaseus]|uniref:DinB-like domain-containing protein n=1 Tax=Flavihumibacter petaseus NBRC 106054 TaxID=1220578 RepID=A0A0E9N1D5_9BACT|nr:DinB family protein [Flavihumibacter petaseus]GAO43145.1 hypothetical protein FPE01S_02_02490 [Flavihumibacter petaseus NBRC 106054]